MFENISGLSSNRSVESTASFTGTQQPTAYELLEPRRRRVIASKKSLESTAGSNDVQQPTEYISPLLPFHQWAQATNAYELLDPRRRRVTEKWLTEDVTFGDLDLIKEAGVTSEDGVRYLVHTSIDTMFQRVYPYLPQSLQDQCHSPKEVIQLKSLVQTQLTIERRKAAFNNAKGKLSQSATERWRRYREEEKPLGIPAFSEQGLANIRANAGRRKLQPANTPLSEGNLHRWKMREKRLRALQAKDQPSEQHDPQDDNPLSIGK